MVVNLCKYTTINAYHVGTSHVKNGLNCEDYSASKENKNFSIAAISDGHGDKNCPRSANGALFACETALELIKDFCIKDSVNSLECKIDGEIKELENKIISVWLEKVFEDIENRPFTKDELSQVSPKISEDYKNNIKSERAYGCTLIAAAVSKDYWFVLQIGDGICTAIFDDGVYVKPVPVDEECCGNRSTSICSENALSSFRHYFSRVMPEAVFVVSDGVQESFDESGLDNCFYSIARWVFLDGDGAKEKLDELLPRISEGGSGDDVSIAGFVNMEKPVQKPRASLEKISEQVASIRSVNEKCKNDAEKSRIAAEELSQNIECKNLEWKNSLDNIKIKKKELEKIKKEIEELENRSYELKKILDKYEESYDEIIADNVRKEENLNNSEEELSKAEAYLLAAEKYWSEKYLELGILLSDEN